MSNRELQQHILLEYDGIRTATYCNYLQAEGTARYHLLSGFQTGTMIGKDHLNIKKT
jgi:hypothetical protein